MSKSKKIIIVISALILLIAIITSAFAIVIHYAVMNNVNYSVDESLLKASRVGESVLYAMVGDETREVARLSGGGARKSYYPLSEISEYLIDGFIAVEDRTFYTHKGFNLKRSVGALFNYAFKLGRPFGASTITQQVIKNISGDNEPTLKRKIAEIMRATHLEKLHTKDEILEAYLNIVPMSDNMAGVGMASRTYFGKEPSSLTLSEAATIIGITNSPAKYNPYIHPEKCLEKRNIVLYAMQDFGAISEEEYEAAKGEPLSLIEKGTLEKEQYSWFTEAVISDLKTDLRKNLDISDAAANMLIFGGGLSVYTTESPDLQMILENYFENTANFPTAIGDGLNYSMVICDSLSGDIVAVVGSVGEKTADRILNYATVPVRPASAIKPLALYAPLLDEGKINWATVFDDIPVEITNTKDGIRAYPHNSPDRYDGLVNVKRALEVSKNTVAVRLYKMMGAEKIYSILKNDLGFDTLTRSAYDKKGNKHDDLGAASLALGQLTHGVSLRNLTSAYTVFPSEGVYRRGRTYTEVYDSSGSLLFENSNEERRVFTPESARIINKLLQNVVDGGTAKSVMLKNIVDTAGKTGTSGNDRDRLFVGYTPYLTAGIWCGYRDSGKSVGKYSPSHLKIWDEIMTECHEALLDKEEKIKAFSCENLAFLPYCMDSGKIYSEVCACDPRGDRMEYGYFYGDNIPKGECDRHVIAYKSDDGEIRISLIKLERGDIPAEIKIADEEFIYRNYSTEEETYSRVFYPPDFLFPDEKDKKGKKMS